MTKYDINILFLITVYLFFDIQKTRDLDFVSTTRHQLRTCLH